MTVFYAQNVLRYEAMISHLSTAYKLSYTMNTVVCFHK